MLENTLKTKAPSIGDRIECSGQLGTIKYIGPVDGYSSTWLGVDWDDKERGKHDGNVNGKRYFTASQPKSGSFVRPEKAQLGQTAISAITSRYGRHDDELTAKFHEQQLLSIQQSINAPFLKLVGFDKITDKQSDFCNLKVVNLRLQNIYRSGEPGCLGELCPNISELDISKNLFKGWIVIFDICSQLKNLTWLNVSENNLIFPDDLSSYCFPSVEILICGSLNLVWSDILKLSQVFPNLEELRVPNNNIRNLDTPVDSFRNLKVLDLENNPIEDWNEILKLGVITKLEQLSVENIGLKSIRFCGSPKTDVFVNIKKLILTDNLISDWEPVGELNKLQSLEELKFLSNPILETENFNTRTQLIIAKIGNLKSLNGSFIASDERRGAEYDYVKKYGLEYLAVCQNAGQLKEFFEKHHRYEELINECGVPEESELIILPKVIKVSLIDIDIVHEDKTLRKKLPPTILVQKLIMLVQRLFNLSERPNLVYVSGTQPDIEIVLDDECKELDYYSMQNGDKIVVKT